MSDRADVMTDRPSWSREAADHYRNRGYWRGETFGRQLRRWAAQWGDREAVVDDRLRLTYAELDAAADRMAGGLHRLGLRRGDRVVVQLPNTADFMVLWFAMTRIGVVPVHAQPGHRGSEITHLARTSEAVAYVLPDRHARFDHRPLGDAVRAEVPSVEHLIVAGEPLPGQLALAEVARGPAVAVAADDEPEPGDTALLLLSGGTTGAPKLIPRTHDDYAYNATAAAEICAMGPDSVYLAVLPIAFNFTMSCPGVLGTLAVGGKVVVSPSPDPGVAFGLIEREKVTITALNPPLAPYWMDEATAGGHDLSSLQVVQIGSARLADDVARRVEPALGARLQQVFGMAEGLLCLTRLDDPDELRHTTQGRPISPDDEVLVVDSEDRPVPPGEPGELLTRGPYTLRGYYRAAEHNTRAFTADGWYRTGDLVRQLRSGHLVVVGRAKDQINRGGEKIAATEMEGHLLAHPAITGAAFVGAPDPRWGERSVAFLVARDGQTVPTRRELAAFLRERGVAAYKHPDQVEPIDGFPLTAVGKVDKNALRARLADA